ncbi:hypothetical protein RPO_07485 [Rickettsia rickettsii str. Arizona]|uniref:Uncharacterized protein n=1 Tax=Rickettsia rickettsii (strain Sheila Smith) TaxID=392021 RepID=A0A0H3AYJ0_RICRS|nr:hypothetical protein A1G_07430 [Rickettsia rickettsii str. 'Sheila Smith']AFB22848.1 hypothetical protein RPN_06975 [Rickettsia rickettsii str. Brazil]AFB24264.1 hypothetical protein RPL_07475 [Rickettsia rickettsii str. Colombia]AFB25608.1 hypothetical protein RPO_07485 [Rickettsia rickettsii str. Arizona]AFB28288.1 hypothetical protein RPJ_07450 [Rickettsia rickettsii str. Hino]AFB30949.1 hypothetical protein RPM_07460 [Rickettsia rickettsii str. Hauke]
MTFFFLLIGSEMKFHLVEGEHKKTNITCSGSPWRCGNSCLNIHVF